LGFKQLENLNTVDEIRVFKLPEYSTGQARTVAISKEVMVRVVPRVLNGIAGASLMKRVFRLNVIARCRGFVARHLVPHRPGSSGNCAVIVALPSRAQHFLRGLKASLFLQSTPANDLERLFPAEKPRPHNVMIVQFHGSSDVTGEKAE
jgi:hypothetical protein